jgi:MoxR-like ATPase
MTLPLPNPGTMPDNFKMPDKPLNVRGAVRQHCREHGAQNFYRATNAELICYYNATATPDTFEQKALRESLNRVWQERVEQDPPAPRRGNFPPVIVPATAVYVVSEYEDRDDLKAAGARWNPNATDPTQPQGRGNPGHWYFSDLAEYQAKGARWPIWTLHQALHPQAPISQISSTTVQTAPTYTTTATSSSSNTQEPSTMTPALSPAQLAQIVQLVGTLIQSQQSVDPDQVKKICADQIESALANSNQPKQVNVTVHNKSLGTTHTIQNAHPMLADVLDVLDLPLPNGLIGKPVALTGPHGCGKSYLAEQAAEARGDSFHLVQLVDSQYTLSGFTDAAGRYVITQMREAWQNGGLLCLDEADGYDPNAMLWSNPALAGASRIAFPDGMIPRHPNFRVIVCTNTFGNGQSQQYGARNIMDAAVSGRCVWLPMDYDAALEQHLIGNHDVLRRLRAMRAELAKKPENISLSTRQGIAAAALVDAKGWNIDKAENAAYALGALNPATRDRLKAAAAAA